MCVPSLSGLVQNDWKIANPAIASKANTLLITISKKKIITFCFESQMYSFKLEKKKVLEKMSSVRLNYVHGYI